MKGDLHDDYESDAASQTKNTTPNNPTDPLVTVKLIKINDSTRSSQHSSNNAEPYYIGTEFSTLQDVKRNLRRNGDVRLSYLDAEGDKIPIESECEYREFFKYCTRNETTEIIVEHVDPPIANDSMTETESFKKGNFALRGIKNFIEEQKQTEMPPKDLASGNSTSFVDSSTVLDNRDSEDTPPKWFTNYMQAMKAEMITEISQRVTTIVLEALTKKRESQYDLACFNPRGSDLESKNREKKSDSCPRSSVTRFESNRRNYRHSQEKQQRKKRSKNHSQTNPHENPDENWPSPSSNRRKRDKTSRNKRDFDEELSELHSRGKSFVGCGESLGEEFESPYQRTLASAMKRSASTPIPTSEFLEKISKLRLADNPYPEMAIKEVNKSRMGCSVTGEDLLDRAKDRGSEYCALSDSDNISIISDVSDNSDKLRNGNGFEMINEASLSCTNGNQVDVEVDPEDPEDEEKARDSSSFEVLSEPPNSPRVSICIDEDHFATNTNETKNYNINDDAINDKRGNRIKLDKSVYAIDAHGKMYQQNIIESNGETSPEIILEKRTGGAYSFAGETLPIPDTKEDENSHSLGDRTAFNLTDDDSNRVTDNERFIHHDLDDSTQSFHSHTAQQTNNNHDDSPATASASTASSQPEVASNSHIFTDHNASKGLGDTKKVSPKKDASSKDTKSEDSCRSEQSKSAQDAPVFENHYYTRHDSRTRKFPNLTTTRSNRIPDDVVFNTVDPMHILPETLVTGAVQAASSAFTTARRVYDKILTAQMRKPAGRSQSKFGRR